MRFPQRLWPIALLCLASCSPAQVLGTAAALTGGGQGPSVDVQAGQSNERTTGVSGGENSVIRIQAPPPRPQTITADNVTTINQGAPWALVLALVALAIVGWLHGWTRPQPGFLQKPRFWSRRKAAQRIAATSLGLALALFVQPAHAQCASYEVIKKKLTDRYGEHMTGLGLSGPTNVIEVWVSEETGTWTIVDHHASGRACMRASGQHWVDVAPLPAGEEH